VLNVFQSVSTHKSCRLRYRLSELYYLFIPDWNEEGDATYRACGDEAIGVDEGKSRSTYHVALNAPEGTTLCSTRH
jgi:hypothetical protein